ncbi:putative exocyst complex component Exo84p [[Candida] railenensis]|uniref:Exocyst complex component EXO84 n=1 Tax=[Candida] railenensis TaxID=45579 RepID=A0A9P0QKP3_9ASCO|nr:putative exocyst complex component Exo84p [[Candida] railenensis]
MDFDTKVAHRKSRAPWQSNAIKSNPYAKANASYTESNAQSGNGAGNSLQVPGNNPNPYGVQSSMLNPGSGPVSGSNVSIRGGGGGGAGGGAGDYLTPNTASNRKASRRMSIHASAAAGNRNRNGYDSSNAPQLPQLYRATSNQSAISTGTTQYKQQVAGDEVNTRIMGDLAGGTAAEIDEYYKVLTKQKAVVTRDIKENINENQKNILELTNDLKDTQDELLQLRVTTRDLYEILDDFKDAAQRRIELENDSSSQYNANRSASNGGSSKANTKRKDRSSIIYLEKMWNDQLQSLFKHVEGASKFIQPIPGRHILAESGRWSEINVGNWKIVKPAHLFILNDVILIATKKYSSGQDTATVAPTTPSASNTPRSSAAYNGNNNTNNATSSKSKLQAVLCWPLHDVKFSEITPPTQINRSGKVDDNKTYSINLKSNSMSYIYQTDRYDHFMKISEAFRKGQHELAQKERAFELANEESRRRSVGRRGDDEDKKSLRDSIRNSGIIGEEDSNSISKSKSIKRLSADVVLQDISAKVHSRNRSHDFKNGSPKLGSSNSNSGSSAFFNDLKRIEDRIDEVDVEIAHNKFLESVGLIRYIENKIANIEASLEQGSRKRQLLQEEDPSATNLEDEIELLIEVINIKIGSRKVKIQKNLIFELQHNITILQGDEISQIMEFFYNFDQLEKGVTAYLQAMSQHLNVTASKLVVGIQGSTKIDVVNYLSNMVIIYVSIVKKTIFTYKEFIVPVLDRDQKNVNGNHSVASIDSSGLIDWCTEEITRLVGGIKKHLYGTLVTITSHDSVTEDPIYKVKDLKLFNEFIGIIKPRLDELKSAGVNLDFLFQDIFLLRYT